MKVVYMLGIPPDEIHTQQPENGIQWISGKTTNTTNQQVHVKLCLRTRENEYPDIHKMKHSSAKTMGESVLNLHGVCLCTLQTK